MQRRHGAGNFYSDGSDDDDTFEQPACSKCISDILKSVCTDDGF